MSENKLRGTQTEQNLINAFAGESQARNRYTFFAKQAKKDGYEQIAAIFLETAENEKEHAKLFYEFIGDTKGHVDGNYPFEFGTTEENLVSAAQGEKEEWSFLYAEGERIAREEGFEELAVKFEGVAKVEAAHERRYKKLLESYKADKTFKGDAPLGWKCRNCGYVHEAEEAPEVCPVCAHPKAYFERKVENY